MMNDVIYRQAAIDAIRKIDGLLASMTTDGQETMLIDKALAQTELMMLPPADVRENVHGEWIDGRRMKMDGTYHWFRECSVCGHERYDANPDKDTDFCPSCGADMRGEDDG